MTRDVASFRPIGAGSVADDDRVVHYDQLAEPAQVALEARRTGEFGRVEGNAAGDAVADGGAGVDPGALPALERGDVVVFTEYYRFVGR